MPCCKNTIKYSKTVVKTWYNRVYSCIVRALCLLVNLPLGQSSVHSKKHCLRLCTLDCSTLSLTYALDGDGRLTPRPGRFISGKETRYPPCRRTVWTGAENLAFIGIRSPDRPTRSKSQYRLLSGSTNARYEAHNIS